MRTTIDLDDDLLRVAKSLARERGKSIGRVVSDYFRLGLRPRANPPEERNGVPLLRQIAGAPPVTPELVKELLEADDLHLRLAAGC